MTDWYNGGGGEDYAEPPEELTLAAAAAHEAGAFSAGGVQNAAMDIQQ